MTEDQRQTNDDRDDENVEGHGSRFPKRALDREASDDKPEDDDTEGHGSRFPKRGLDDESRTPLRDKDTT